MKAAVFYGSQDIRCEDVPDPVIQESRDAIIAVTATAICGSDLHIYNGLIPQPRPMVLGHEFMGIVQEVGKDVTNLKKGDRVVVPFPIACGGCFFCKHQLPGHCENSNPGKYGPEGGIADGKGGGMFGYTDLYGGYNGGQAEAVRVPYADFGPRKVPDQLTDEQVLFLTDIFPTGWSGVDWAQLNGGETVMVFGCGPVGLMAMKSAWLNGAGRVIGVDIQDYRLELARTSAKAETLNYNAGDVVQAIRDMTDGRGGDVCIDAVGMEADRSMRDKLDAAVHMEKGTMKVLECCFDAVRRGGKVSVLGVYGMPYHGFPLHQIFDKGISIFQGQAPVHKYIDRLIELVVSGKVVLNDIISHRIPLGDVANGYKIFCDKLDNCTKVVLKP